MYCAMEILEARDKRVKFISDLLKHEYVILSLRVNYPGLGKDNETTRKISTVIDLLIQEKLKLKARYFLNDGEGPVYIYLIESKDAISVKLKTIKLEEEHSFGRLVDLDVYYKNIKSISRGDLNVKSRNCMLCSEDAFICIKKQTHSTNEIIEYIKGIVNNYDK